MRYRRVAIMVIVMLAIAGAVGAQSGADLTGRVLMQDSPMPGVTVSLTSPAMQGERVTVTNAQGDYIFKSLPAGDYRVTFALPGFATLEYDVKMSAVQPRTLDAVMYPEAVEEEIIVTGALETVSTGTQGSSTIEQSVLEKLPVQRTLNQAVLLSAGASDTGPGGNISISGAQSWESLYTINGVVVNENIRGQALDLYIEDAVLETTTITNSASAEYGRFAGGIVNTITKSGGNEFSGSFRVNVDNESWNGETPLTIDQVDENNYVYEATFGGYILKDRLWFFTAGRDLDDSGSGQLIVPGQPEAAIPYPTTRTQTRLEGKLTGSITNSHRVTASYLDIEDDRTNRFNFEPAADFAALFDESVPQTGWSVNYTGVLTDNFFLEALYSQRELSIIGGGGTNTELGGSPIWDLLESITFNDAWFDGAGPPKERDNENYYAKASWFLSAGGTHDLIFGYDFFDDQNTENNRQMASGFAYAPFVEQNYDEPGNPLVVIEPYGGYIIWGDVLEESQGSHVETTSVFANDTWRVNDKLTVGFGVRYDKNEATDQAGLKTVDDDRISPRLSASYDVKGDGSIIVTGGYSRYVTSITQNQGTAGSAAGNPVYNWYLYAGPEIVAGTPEFPTNADALDAMFDWFFNVYGGTGNLDLAYYISIPGLTPRVGDNLSAPYSDEYTLGASFRLGNKGVVRADYVHREFGSFYASEITPGSTVQVPGTDTLIDQSVYINDDSVYNREYDALMARLDYRIGSRWDIGANYTLSRTYGNFDGETFDIGPIPGSFFEYQEYKEVDWNVPDGLLGIDQTHRLRAWVVWEAIATNRHNLSVSLLQSFLSGTPYAAIGRVDTIPFVGDPADLGYANAPGAPLYYFTDRGEFRTEDVTRTDLALNYSFFVDLFGGQLELFIQPEVTNVFNEDAVVTPNTTVFTARNDSSLETFNPFTETPVEGVHWAKGPSFGQPQDDGDFQQPRTYRISVGLRF
ncbi:MAG TPA: TonB-dependent receptor [Methylomirabilota bacterium]|nr:TonB-dependent receptor [Methylomirabilota bacterium]